jgi:hypothetical protein
LIAAKNPTLVLTKIIPMKFIFFLLLPISILMSCGNEYGNKVTINSKSDVFYKGEGVTEADAKRLGDMLLKEGYFDTTSSKSVQLTKDSSTWVVRLVVDREKFAKADGTIAMSMKIMEMVISEQVFNKENTRLELVDDKMNPIDIVGKPAATNDSLSNQETIPKKDGLTKDSLSKD